MDRRPDHIWLCGRRPPLEHPFRFVVPRTGNWLPGVRSLHSYSRCTAQAEVLPICSIGGDAKRHAFLALWWVCLGNRKVVEKIQAGRLMTGLPDLSS